VDAEGRLELTAPGVIARLDPGAGGRVAALVVDGLDLLLTEGYGPIAWGCYPMVPWAGRLRDGRLRWGGEEHRLPTTMPPHAIHGTTWDAPWRVAEARPDRARLEIELGPPWPFGGRAVHEVVLGPDALALRLEVNAGDRPMPAIVGWHPWFARRLARGDPAILDLAAGGMLAKGPDGLPTGEVVPPPPGPWDDCFIGLVRPPVVRWPGAVAVSVRSDAAWWVVYTEREEGICIEPQTGPPNGFWTGEHATVSPGEPLVATMTLAWERLGRTP
jgi:aldose 1-epimerase